MGLIPKVLPPSLEKDVEVPKVEVRTAEKRGEAPQIADFTVDRLAEVPKTGEHVAEKKIAVHRAQTVNKAVEVHKREKISTPSSSSSSSSLFEKVSEIPRVVVCTEDTIVEDQQIEEVAGDELVAVPAER